MIFDNSPDNGAAATRGSKFFKSCVLWKYFANYFPLTLHKTVDLEPTFVVKIKTPPPHLNTPHLRSKTTRPKRNYDSDSKDPLDSDSSEGSNSTIASNVYRGTEIETDGVT